jgi:ribonuclease Z
MKRVLATIVIALVAIVIVAAASLWYSHSLQDAFVARIARAHVKADRVDLLNDGALHIVLCGTGSPLPDPDRAAACIAVLAAGHIVLIDSGPGSTARLTQENIPMQRIDAVLLTHLHSDHIGDLGNTAFQGWIAGRKTPLDVYGPPGTDDVVSGFAQVFKADTGFRIRHHGAAALPPSGKDVEAHIIALPPQDGSVVVYSRDGLVIRAFLVDHRPIVPAFGFRAEFGGRVVVFSGDTRANANVQHFAMGADLLIHEALSRRLVGNLATQLDAVGDHRRAKMMRDTFSYHTTPVEAARIANAAKVRLLVFSHVVPPLPNVFIRRMFLDGVDDAAGSVPVMLGHDGMMLTLRSGSTDIERSDLF